MEENVITLADGTEMKESELSQEQAVIISHIRSLKDKVARLEFEINELVPSLRFYENAFVESTKEKAEEVLEEKSNNTKNRRSKWQI